jgi:Domain of unknown function (DUF6456)
MSDPVFSSRRSIDTAEIISPEGRRQRAVINEAENPLLWLFKRKGQGGAPLISAAQFAAGEKLREDYTRGHLGRRVTSCWDPQLARAGRGGAGSAATQAVDFVIAAKARFADAMDAVGPELSGILLQVCCLASGLEQAERALNLPVRSGKAVLGLALTRLARHYGLLRQERPRPMVQSAMEGYRPSITPAPPGRPV